MTRKMRFVDGGFFESQQNIITTDYIKNHILSLVPEAKKYKHCTFLKESLLSKSLVKNIKNVKVNLKNLVFEEDGIKNKYFNYYAESPKKDYLLYAYTYFDGATPCIQNFVFYNSEKELLSYFSFDNYIKLERGVYEVIEGVGGPTVNKVSLTEFTKPILNEGYQDVLLEDVKKFFKNEKFYKDNGFTYKRGLLLFGPGGTGKSSLIKYIGTQVDVPTLIVSAKIDMDSLLKELIDVSCPNGCVVAIEDIDGIEMYKRSELLNFLDGFSSPKKCYFIATTNHIDKIGYAIANRPSRFDMVVEVPAPNKEARRELIKHYFKGEEKNIDMEKVLKETDTFTGAFIKELYILYKVNQISIEEAIKRLNQHMRLAKLAGDNTDYID